MKSMLQIVKKRYKLHIWIFIIQNSKCINFTIAIGDSVASQYVTVAYALTLVSKLG